MVRQDVNILLMGPRGSGKTALGGPLAVRLGLRFVDLDERVLDRFPAASVRSVWERYGESAWREAEVAALREVLRDGGQIVALGGGTPAIEEARDLIETERRRGRARVIYLSVPLPMLERRLAGGPGDRPSLTGGEVVAEMAEVLRDRDPLYRAIADLVYEPREDGKVASSLAEIAELVAGALWMGED